MSTPSSEAVLERGVFVLSLDFELAWGTLDLPGAAGFRRACMLERELVPRLLDLLSAYGVSATWCTVGHLFLAGCPAAAGPRHPEIVRPRHAWARGDWFAGDPGGDETSEPLFFGRSLIRRIQGCRVPQEIGSHSFSHVIFGDAGCPRETAASELDACLRAAREMGIDLASFAFPRNSVGHLDVLRERGFSVIRGTGPRWYERQEPPGRLARLARLLELLRVATPAAHAPRRLSSGLWDVPGSMVYQPMHGLRRLIPIGFRVARARKGLADAVARKRVFHLWFHPTNLADQTEAMFAGLEQILVQVSALCRQGSLLTLTMGELARRLGADRGDGSVAAPPSAPAGPPILAG